MAQRTTPAEDGRITMKKAKIFTIEPYSKVSQLQKDFNAFFPYLKIEFFSHFHEIHGGSPKKDMIKSDIILKPKKKSISFPIAVSEDMPVSVLEELFKEYFGLSAQVFRKSGRSWLETSMTDDWTLKRQNDEGTELSNIA